MSKFGKAAFPFEVRDEFCGEPMKQVETLGGYLSNLGDCEDEVARLSMSINFAKYFIDTFLPNKMREKIDELQMKHYKMLTQEERNILMNKKMVVINWDDAPKGIKAPKKQKAPAKKEAHCMPMKLKLTSALWQRKKLFLQLAATMMAPRSKLKLALPTLFL